MSQLSSRGGRGAPVTAAVLVVLALVWAPRPARALHLEPFGPTEPVRGQALDVPSKAEAGLVARLDRIPDRAALVIPLPEGGRIVAVRSGLVERRGGDFLWHGKPQGRGGDVVLTVTKGAIAGSITTGEETYLIRTAPNGQVRILMVDEGALPVEIGAAVTGAETGGAETGTPPASPAGNVVIDVMILYTPAARTAAGGAAQVEASIQNAVDYANVAYANSLVSVEQRLVHTGEVAYDEATQCASGGSRDMECDLVWLRGNAGVASLRNTYGADLVALITQGGQYCGIGYVMTGVSSGFAPYAFSVTLRTCLPSTHAHETGHNLGCMHDPDSSGYPGAHDFAFGHRYCMTGGFRTIMSYACSGASRIPHFANPDVSYDAGAGVLATGTWAADCTPTCSGSSCAAPCRDCAQTIDLAAPTTAAFRASATATCGDGVVNQAGEECDGGDFGGETCASLGFDGGSLACTASCTIDAGACATCGNGVREPGEECEGADLGGASCVAHGCAGGDVTCTASCTVSWDACVLCCGDGACEPGEDCGSCDLDCASGSASQCGNGVCEAGDGEDCVSCPADCRGVQGGKPSGRYCCGDGDGQNPRTCGDSICTSGGWQCTSAPGGTYCCGDGACWGPETGLGCEQDCGAPPVCGDGECNGAETSCSCGVDCGAPPSVEASCMDGLDEDCDGLADCDDGDCSGDAVCSCLPRNASCSSGAECCSGVCSGRGKKRVCG